MKKVMNVTMSMVLFASAVTYANGPKKRWGKNAPEVVKEIIEIELDPAFKRKGNKLYLNLLNLDQEKVTIKVYDSEGRIIFRETFDDALVIEKAFNFERAYEDEYTVVVIDNNETFKEVVEVK